MADTNDIFTETPEGEDNNNDITVDTLVGETQKYKTVDELAKAYSNADAYINQMKAKEAEREAELKVLRDLNEARNNNKDKSQERPVNNEDRGNENRPNDAPVKKDNLNDVDLKELVRKELEEVSEQTKKANNINTVADRMNNYYGSAAKAQEAVNRRARELGVSVDWLRDAASSSPSAFFASMGIDVNSRSNNTPSISNEVNLRAGNGNLKDFKYFDEIRKTNPKLYNSRDVQNQMMAARRELGDRFFPR